MTSPEDDLEEMRTKFDEAVAAILSQKREDNKAFLSAEEYGVRLEQLKRSKLVLRTAGEKKSMKDYRMVRKYDILTVDGAERLVRPGGGASNAFLFYVTNEQLFDVLHEAHCHIGHGGRNRMVAELRTKYCNVTKEAVMTYLKLCAHCRRRKTATAAACGPDKPPSAVASRCTDRGTPVLLQQYGSRARVQLIDMQTRVYDGYRFIMNHRDDATKFVHLVPLRSIRPEEVAFNLLDVYAAFGVPAVLESHCGREYIGSVIEHIRSTCCDWPEIVYVESEGDRPRRAGTAHRNSVQKMLDVWMANRNCDNWPLALKFLQLQTNCDVHPGMSPYQAMFGYPAGRDWPSADFTCKSEYRDDTTEEMDSENLLELNDNDDVNPGSPAYVKIETENSG